VQWTSFFNRKGQVVKVSRWRIDAMHVALFQKAPPLRGAGLFPGQLPSSGSR
jgi:hypothetical protein